MSVVEPGPAGGSLAARVGAMLFRPGRTWGEVEAEETPHGEILRRYVMPLAAVHAVCGLIGMMLFGYSIAGIGFRANPLTAVLEAAVDFTLTLGLVLVAAAVIDLLAGAFGGRRSFRQALKLAAYSATAYWVAGVFSLYPSFGILAGLLAALYSLYVLYLGLPRLMRLPQDRLLSGFAAILAAVLALAALKGFLVSRVAELGGPLRAAALGSGLA
ncbi:Yip1 family protein [Phenylobacterium sp.]|uniref:Yip1 family protein n=1 Tax=Phenylobacterium sp. TaxID=1871053 RepID=UPI0035AD7CC1